MKIVLLNDDALPTAKGGVAVVIDFLRKGLTERGHTVTLITTHQDKARPAEERVQDTAGETISLFVHYPKWQRHRRAVSRTSLSKKIEKILAERSPDVVHAHNVHNHLTYDVLRVARKFTERVFLTAHDTFSISFGRVSGKRYEEAAQAGTPYRMHWLEHLKAAEMGYWPLRNGKIRRILSENVKSVIVYTKAMESFLHANGIVKTMFVRSGIPPLPSPPQESIEAFRTRFDLQGPTVLYAARISADKGIDVLLKVIEPVRQQVPNVRFLIVGDRDRIDPYLQALPDEVRNCIRTTGWLKYDEYKTVYFVSNVVVTPSVYLDNFPTVNLEAMAASRAVIGTCFGGTPEVVVDGVTGYIVHPRDTDAFAAQLVDLLTKPARAKAMGEAGRRRIESEFAMQGQLDRLLKAYQA